VGLSAVGLQLIPPVLAAIALLFVAWQTLLLLPPRRLASAGEPARLGALFLLSGVAALIYQVVWQRLLYSRIGVNIEAVTLIVSVFMLGLGLGAFAGGRLSLRLADRLPLLFAIIEVSIGLFGAFSLGLITLVGDAAAAAGLVATTVALMLLLFPPTLLMGATLPVLVAQVHRTYGDVGRTVGLLYFANTLGSAIACFATVGVLFAFLGLRGATLVAVGLNVLVAAAVYRRFARSRSAA
jgi:predicted membrane-bound spermidine synthase